LVFIQFYEWWCTEPWTWRLLYSWNIETKLNSYRLQISFILKISLFNTAAINNPKFTYLRNYLHTYLLTYLTMKQSYWEAIFCSVSRNSSHFIASEGLLPHSQVLPLPYPKPARSSPYHHLALSKDPSYYYPSSMLGSPKWALYIRFPYQKPV
jgi:hypothetical protein